MHASLAETLEPLRADPLTAAVLLDVDGTLAPIVRHSADADVPESTRSTLIEVSKRYGTVACVSGRLATEARRIVSIGSISYVGNHGCELLRAASTKVEVEPKTAAWSERIGAFAARADTVELQQLRIRREAKGPIAAFHWRGAPDEDAARSALTVLEDAAHAAGYATHWGRKVLEVRPPLAIDKGRGIVWLLRDNQPRAAVYVGDDLTDLDAFGALREILGAAAYCVGVRSDETPPELEAEADAMVNGTAGVRALLTDLLR